MRALFYACFSIAGLFWSSTLMGQGFGGESETCQIVVDGIERPCETSPPKKASGEAVLSKTVPKALGRNKEPLPPTLEDRKIRPKAVVRPKRGWRFSENNEETIKDVLGDFKQKLDERRRELEVLEDRPIYKRQERERIAALRALIEREDQVATTLENRAKGQMLACAQVKHKKWFKRYGISKGIKMTPAGPVAAKPEIGADPPGCERSRFVSATLLRDALRFFELDYILKNRRWEYGQGKERNALKLEHENLEASLRLGNALKVRKYNQASVDALYLKGDADGLYLKNQKEKD